LAAEAGVLSTANKAKHKHTQAAAVEIKQVLMDFI
jgi:hypothetical protein